MQTLIEVRAAVCECACLCVRACVLVCVRACALPFVEIERGRSGGEGARKGEAEGTSRSVRGKRCVCGGGGAGRGSGARLRDPDRL